MTYWVYILASKPGGTLYVGVTNNLVRRSYAFIAEAAELYHQAVCIRRWSLQVTQSRRRFGVGRELKQGRGWRSV
jgi:predicted GIY-YIG superfamily endonuclease